MKKTINNVQCCYCKNSQDHLSDDFHNVQEGSMTETEDRIIKNHIAHGCYVCKQIADRQE